MKVQSELTGVVHKIYGLEERGNFKIKEFVVRVAYELNGEENFNYFPIQLFGDAIDMLDDINSGDTVKVKFDIRGKNWVKNGSVQVDKKGKDVVFVNLVATSVELLSKPEPSTPPDSSPSPPEEDDLPF